MMRWRSQSLASRNAASADHRVAASRKRKEALVPLAWIFRTNIPMRRGMPLPNDIQKRNFFGIGEVLSVLTNPGETLKSLTEARKSLEEARKEIKESKERSQLRTTHTFAPLPGFFPRPAELKAVERALAGSPAFTVLVGASSVGKTALLREVLSRDAYHVLHFDLRIAGFADLGSLYVALSRQMEQYFQALSTNVEGYEEFEKEAWAFKHDRLSVEQMIEKRGVDGVKTSDVARLMELFQSALLHYWQFDPAASEAPTSSQATKVEESERIPSSSKEKVSQNEKSSGPAQEKSEAPTRPQKKIPVLFIDEAHKLPALIRSTDAMKCLLDAMLVLTKQDRLCHVIHATSDGFYQTWLRQLNIMQHCKLISVGDCSRRETRRFFKERLLPGVPEELRNGLDFETLYDAFGGKLVHWTDYASDYVNANGDLPVKMSSHFLQAYTLLHLHLVNCDEPEMGELEAQQQQHSDSKKRPASPMPSRKGFKIYSPLSADTAVAPGDETASVAESSPSESAPAFSRSQLLDVMRRLIAPTPHSAADPACNDSSPQWRHDYIPYFGLCREFGVHAVDDLVRARVLELRWMDTVTSEWEEEIEPDVISMSEGRAAGTASPSGWPVQDSVLGEEGGRPSRRSNNPGPKLVPMTPIVRYAMREVLREYEPEDGDEYRDDEWRVSSASDRPTAKSRPQRKGSDAESARSDYVSLSDVSEY